MILGKTSDFLDRISRAMVLVASCVMVLAVLLQVFFRYVLNSPLSWPEELTIYLMAWMAFVGSAVAVKSSEHIGVDLLLTFLPGRGKNVLLLVVKIVMMIFAVFLFKAGLQMSLFGISMISDALRISMFWPRLSMPVGGLIMIVHLTYMILTDIEMLFEKDVAA
ncbi:MAG: TRAP transporter small permease [Desulfocucumaceae bacterium]